MLRTSRMVCDFSVALITIIMAVTEYNRPGYIHKERVWVWVTLAAVMSVRLLMTTALLDKLEKEHLWNQSQDF